MLPEMSAGLRYARDLTGFLRGPFSPAECDARMRRALATRSSVFLQVVEHAVFRHAASPCKPLFESAGIDLGDVVRLVNQEGVEGALGRLYDAGVRFSLDEFKGRRPLKRGRTERALSPADFDNPLLTPHFVSRTGGSRGPRRRLVVDLGLLAHEADSEYLLLAGLGVLDRPAALWRPVPPGSAGLKMALRRARIGRSFVQWFTQQQLSFARDEAKYGLLTLSTVAVGRLAGRSIPYPTHVPVEQAWRVTAWLADQRKGGRSPILDTNPASAVRVCQAAFERSMDIGGTLFRLSGEPYTAGKADVLMRAGCSASTHYGMSEAGRIGTPCAAPAEIDEVHLLHDKIGLIQRPVAAGPARRLFDAFFLTTLHPSTPKIMLNVDSGDYASKRRGSAGARSDGSDSTGTCPGSAATKS